MKKKIQFSKIYFLGLLILFVLFLVGSRPVYTHLTMYFTEDPRGDAYTSVYCGDEKIADGEVEDAVAELFFWASNFTKISPIHYDSHEELYITRLKVRMNGFLVCDLNPEQILKQMTPNDHFEYVKVTQQGLKLKTKDDFPAFDFKQELLDRMEEISNIAGLLGFVFFALIYSILYWYLFVVLDICYERSYDNFLNVVLGIVGVTAMILAWRIAFESSYGVTVHPDEMQTRAAIDYYRTHWVQPDVRSVFVAETVSGYGMTRLSEINLYYLFAGKFANLCVFEMSFRALGMLMILILTCFVLKNTKKERWIAILFFATPQLWYLFSYATSDAFDYLFTVFAVYEVLTEKSALNRILGEPFTKRQIPAYLGIGFVFANLLMAKKTFYAVLVTLFLILLYRLIFTEKEDKKSLLKKYIGILIVAFSVVLIRYIPDFRYYGFEKSVAVEQVIEETAWTEYKPSTPAHLQAKSTLLYKKGVTLKEFFSEWEFNEELFKNYFGHYGIYSLEAENWYYGLMGVLYIALFLTVGCLFYKKTKEKKICGEKTAMKTLTYWTMWGMIGMMYLLTIYNAYFVDFQPQGRYLFPALPALACQLAIYKEVEEHPVVRSLIVSIALVSLYSFYKIAYLNF